MALSSGMPLALELAAARWELLGTRGLVDRVGDPLKVLARRGAQDPRHATLRTAIAWSWDLLDEEHRGTLQTLATFGGTFSVKMSEISGEMVKEKVHHISAVEPEYLIGADISCLMNIGGRMTREGRPVKVLHIVDVLMSR